jgi:hypothetical protein
MNVVAAFYVVPLPAWAPWVELAVVIASVAAALLTVWFTRRQKRK